MLLLLLIGLKILMVAVLWKIASTDFTTQKIRNDDVLSLLALGISSMAVIWLATRDFSVLVIAVIAALILFCFLLPFWLLAKVGAGDVKLLAVAPVVISGGELVLFSIILLVTTALTTFVVKNPLILPKGAFRRYVEFLDRKQVVPFGVPVSVSLAVVLLLQVARAVLAAAK